MRVSEAGVSRWASGAQLCLLLLGLTMISSCGAAGGTVDGPQDSSALAGTYVLTESLVSSGPGAVVREEANYKLVVTRGTFTINSNFTYSYSVVLEQTIRGTTTSGTWTGSGAYVLNSGEADFNPRTNSLDVIIAFQATPSRRGVLFSGYAPLAIARYPDGSEAAMNLYFAK